MSAVVLGAFAWADGGYTYLRFNADTRTVGDENIVGYTDNGSTPITDVNHPKVYWWADDWAPADYEQPAAVSNDVVQSFNYLMIESDYANPLLRTFSTVREASAASYVYDPVDVEDHGLFVDTTLQFCGADAEPAIGNNKILVWLKETVDDPEEGTEAYTNLMVTCGSVDPSTGSITPVTYALDTDVRSGEYHRLTVRSGKVQGDNYLGFKIFIDEVQVGAQNGGPSVFPSLVASDQQVSAVGFGGKGMVQKVDLLGAEYAPEFAKDPTYLTISWTQGVASFTIGDGDPIEVTGEGSTNLIVAAGETSVTATFVQEPVAYKLGEFIGTGITVTTDGNTATFDVPLFAAEGQCTLAIEAVEEREGAQLWISEDGEIYTQAGGNMPKVKDVIAYINAHGEELGDTPYLKIVLLEDEEGNDFGDWSTLADYVVCLDLNGHSLTGTNPWREGDDTLAIIYTKGNLTITDTSSTGGGAIIGVIDDNNPILPIWNENTVTIEAATGTNPIKFYGPIANYSEEGTPYMLINGGKFNPKVDLVPGSVELAGGKVWSAEPDEDGYYEVVDDGPVTTYQITVAEATEGVTLASITTNDVPVIEPAVAGKYNIDLGVSAVVTYELEEGYKLVDGSAALVQTLTEAAPTSTSPTAEILTFTVTVNLGENVKATVTNLTAGGAATVYTGESVNNYTVNYDDSVSIEYESLLAGYEPTQEAEIITNIKQDHDLMKVELDPDPIIYDITYVYKTNNVEIAAADIAGLVNENPTDFTVEDAVVISAAKISATDYDVTSVSSEGWAAGTYTDDQTVTVVLTKKAGGWDPTVGPTVPASEKGITGELANASFKDLSTWAQTYSIPFQANMDQYKDAFLLNCAPGEVAEKAKDFKFASITQDSEGNWVVTIDKEFGDNHRYGNGIAVITRYSDVYCKEPSATGAFFKATLEVYSVVP